jgi:hypothetical protein
MDAVLRIERCCPVEEGRHCFRLLIGEHFCIDEPRMVVDCHMDEIVSDMLLWHCAASMHPMASSFGNASELLDVDMNECSWGLPLISADPLTRRSVQPFQDIDPLADKHRVNGRGRKSKTRANAKRTQFLSRAQRENLFDLPWRGLCGRAAWTGTPIQQSGNSTCCIAALRGEAGAGVRTRALR